MDFRTKKHVQAQVICEGGCGVCLGLEGTVRINKALWLLANEQ